jgi:hypothetical protein
MLIGKPRHLKIISVIPRVRHNAPLLAAGAYTPYPSSSTNYWLFTTVTSPKGIARYPGSEACASAFKANKNKNTHRNFRLSVPLPG